MHDCATSLPKFVRIGLLIFLFAATGHREARSQTPSIGAETQNALAQPDSESPDSESPDAEPFKIASGAVDSQTAPGDHGVTYHVQAPHDYRPGEERPLLIAFSPSGNGRGLLQKFGDAIDKAGWILVCCDKLRNGMKDPALEIEMEDEVLADIFRKIPHDPKRVYLAGFSGGAMRAYGITARRGEPYAGVIAFGGWLGGPDYQDEPYREGMDVAMINGTHDLGAGGWATTDAKTLRTRNCTTKLYAFPGGHTVAPAEVTSDAVGWLQARWNARQSSSPSDKLPLEILYVGNDPTRSNDFKSFLSQYFASVVTAKPQSLTLSSINHADVMLIDSTVRTLPEHLTKAMVMIGSHAAMTGERYGSKIDWLCQCLDNEAYQVDINHPIFRGPLPVTPTLVSKRCPHTDLKIRAWKVEQPQETPGLVASRKHFESAKDSEIISGGVNMKGVSGVSLVREAHRLLWGFIAPPSQMTEEGRRTLVNAISWIHQFDGKQQRDFAGLHSRSEIDSVLSSPYVDERSLARWFTQDLINKTGADKEKIRNHFADKIGYVYVPRGSGQLQIDKQALSLNTPNNTVDSLKKWAELLDGDQSAVAFQLLSRYSGQRFRKNASKWRHWVEQNADQLVFEDASGYHFVSREARRAENRPGAQTDNGTQGASSELTEVAPVQFEIGLTGLHLINGVTYQYQKRKFSIIVRARVKPGWHFYASDQDNGPSVPTSIELKLPEGFQFDGEWENPHSVDGKLSDGATFHRSIEACSDPRDLEQISGTIRFQACTGTRCLQPQSLNFSRPVTIMKR